MTVSKALITWLYGFGSISVDESIDTDTLAANAAAYGLYKTPQTVIVPFVDGSRDVTAYYTLCVRQRANQESKRQDNQEWLEALEKWVRTQNLAQNFPEMVDSRECYGVGIANTFTMMEPESSESIYQMTLSISYTEKG